jgi:hypothetical protein
MLICLAIDPVAVILGYGRDEDQHIGKAVLLIIHHPNSNATQSLHRYTHSNYIELSADILLEVVPVLKEY